jgi:hypothetical protein
MRKIFSSPVFQPKNFHLLSPCAKAAPVNVRIPVVFNNYSQKFSYNEMAMKNHNFGKRKNANATGQIPTRNLNKPGSKFSKQNDKLG